MCCLVLSALQSANVNVDSLGVAVSGVLVCCVLEILALSLLK
jgi:hypothetical protein